MNDKMRIAILEEQLRQALAKLHRISCALLGEPDTLTIEVPISPDRGDGNLRSDSEFRL